MQKRNVLNSPRLLELKKHRRRAILNKILIILFGLIAVFILLAYLSCFNSLNITGIQISGNKVVDTETLRATVESQIAGKYLWLFPKTNILYYPQNAIKNELQNKFKRLKDINLSIQNNKILLVSVTERIAKYTWCGAIPPPDANPPPINTNSQKCYFLDEDGYIFDEAPYFSGEVYFKFYGSADIGSYFSKQNFKRLISFKDILVGIGLKPVSLYITNDGDVNIFLSRGNSSTNEPKIIFKIDADFQNVAENLEAALTTEPLQSEFKNKYSLLQYIDLRFGNKVYYKFSVPALK
jgi:hypothetical protein